jgi:hypothetical protein
MNENMNNSVRDQQVKFLFEKGVSGHRFDPPFVLTVSENALRTWFGGHNAAAYFFRRGDKYTGVRLHCECPDCLIKLGIFVVENPTTILANGVGSWSVFRTDSCHAECLRRTETRLEENIRQQKAAEKAKQQQEARRRELIGHVFCSATRNDGRNVLGIR